MLRSPVLMQEKRFDKSVSNSARSVAQRDTYKKDQTQFENSIRQSNQDQHELDEGVEADFARMDNPTTLTSM